MFIKKLLVGMTSAVTAGCMFTATAFAESGGTAAQAPSTAGSLLGTVISMGIALVLLYLIMFRPQQKREKEAQQMRENVRIGDEICTAGGIVGIVLKINDDSVVLETGGERNKIRVKKWAIHENITQMEEKAKEEKERKAQRQNGIATAGLNDSGSKPSKKKKEN